MKKNLCVPKIAALLFCMAGLAISCERPPEVELSGGVKSKDNSNARLQDEQKRLKIKQVTYILMELYKDPAIREEVNAAIKSGYYNDERVLLKDLLYPNFSPVYKLPKFTEIANTRKIVGGKFTHKFFKTLRDGSYTDSKLFKERSGARTSDEYFDDGGVSIYYPYSDNFNSPDEITLTPAEQDSDTGVGQRPYICGGNRAEPIWCYQQIGITDNYAYNNATHIVGVGAEPNPVNITSGTQPVKRVFVGWVRCTKHYDRLISFTGNGGGSELRFVRGSGYLKFENQQVTNPEDVVPVDISRKDIRQGNWVRVYSLWDPDWNEPDSEQVFGIYEDDTQGEKKFEGGLSTTVKATIDSITVERKGNIGFSITVKTQDDLIRQIKWSQESYFRAATIDQGHGFHDGWPIYDGNSHVSYTLPNQTL